MKKLFKSLLAILITVISVLSLTTPVLAASVPESIRVITTPPQPGNSWYIEDLYVGTKITTTGEAAYCLDYHKDTPLDTTVTALYSMDNGMVYLIENGYPNKSFTGNNDEDHYITQVAIWWYLDETTGSHNLTDENKNSTSEVMPYIRNLVTGAIDARTNGYNVASIGLSIDNDTLTITQDKKNFISNEVTVDLEFTDTYTVRFENAPEGTYAIDLAGNRKEVFNKNENFKVVVPVEKANKNNSTFQVYVTANGSTKSVYEYLAANDGEQNILPAIIYNDPVSIDANIELNVIPETPVPNTNSNLIFMYIIGSILIITGLVFVRTYAKDQK